MESRKNFESKYFEFEKKWMEKENGVRDFTGCEGMDIMMASSFFGDSIQLARKCGLVRFFSYFEATSKVKNNMYCTVQNMKAMSILGGYASHVLARAIGSIHEEIL